MNGDAMTVAAGAALVLALTRWVRAGEGRRGIAAIGAAAGLVVLGRVNGYPVLVPTLAWVVWALRRRTLPVSDAARAAAIAVAVSAPMLAWNAIRNRGDPLGLSNYRRYMAEQWHVTAPPPDGVGAFASAFGRSSFGLFRNMDLPLPPAFYSVALAMLIVGVALAAWRAAHAGATGRAAAAWLAAAVAASVGLVVHYSWFVDFAPEGRYSLLPTLVLVIVTVLAPWDVRPWGRWWSLACVAFLITAAGDAAWLIWSTPCL